MKPIDRKIFKIALPAIVSNITVPLLGLVDTAIVGHMGSASFIGAIAVGGVIFSVIYWLFTFLRMGTSGLTAQDLGAGNESGITDTLYRACLLAVIIGVGLIALHRPIFHLAMQLMDAEPEVAFHARTYFYTCIWGAVGVQLMYALNGWFIGMQNTRIPMVVAIVQNVVNIPLSLLLVFGCGMDIAGVALGTVLAQYLGVAVAVVALWRKYRQYLTRIDWRGVLQRSALLRFLNVNRDIMLRMVCLIAVTTWFTAMGSKQGELILAANAILFQLFYLFSFFFDGFANAAEAMCGKYKGARNVEDFALTVKHVFICGIVLVALFTTCYVVGEDMILGLLSDNQMVLDTARDYFHWLLLVPACGIMAFVWDGVFIGVTSTRRLLLSMFVGTVVFFAAYLWLFPKYGNDGLWISFLLYLLARGMTLSAVFPKVIREI
ncbi:MAG: MATE family efflux transporter [Bacteroidaceae bacterium]|nr:MATE family efflux transporter [Bacteroidaceae bacterium]